MIIDAFILAYNEERILPLVLRHYKKFCRNIYVLDNMSTDNTPNIIKEFGAHHVQWENPEGIDERVYLELKQDVYRKLTNRDQDWVIVVDADEVIYHPDLINVLKNYKSQGITSPKTIGLEMLDITFPKPEMDIISQGPNVAVKKENLCKRCIFNPKIDMVWDVGCHPSNVGEKLAHDVLGFKSSDDALIQMRHYKWLDFEYVWNRYQSYGSRLSNWNKSMKLGYHYLKSKSELELEYKQLWDRSEKL